MNWARVRKTRTVEKKLRSVGTLKRIRRPLEQLLEFSFLQFQTVELLDVETKLPRV